MELRKVNFAKYDRSKWHGKYTYIRICIEVKVKQDKISGKQDDIETRSIL